MSNEWLNNGSYQPRDQQWVTKAISALRGQESFEPVQEYPLHGAPAKPTDDEANSTLPRLTPQAVALLTLLLDAIVDDPHPSWTVSRTELPRIARAYADALPLLFARTHADASPLVTDQKPPAKEPKVIGTFDIVHALEKHLPIGLCIIPK